MKFKLYHATWGMVAAVWLFFFGLGISGHWIIHVAIFALFATIFGCFYHALYSSLTRRRARQIKLQLSEECTDRHHDECFGMYIERRTELHKDCKCFCHKKLD